MVSQRARRPDKTLWDTYQDIAHKKSDTLAVVAVNGKTVDVAISNGAFSNVEVFLKKHYPFDLTVDKQEKHEVGYFQKPSSDSGVGSKRGRGDEAGGIASYFKTSVRTPLVWAFVIGGWPLNFYETMAGRFVVRTLTGQSVPGLSRASITRGVNSLFEEKAAEKATKLRHHVNSGAQVALQADGWTSAGRDGYMGIVVHLMTSDFMHCSIRIGVTHLPGPSTTVRLREVITKKLEEVGLAPANVVSMICDNAHNYQGIFPNTVRCLIHTAMLAVKDAVASTPWLVNLFAASNHTSVAILGSTKRLDALTAKQEELGVPALRPKSQVPTRWLTQYLQLVRLLQIIHPMKKLSKDSLGMSTPTYTDFSTNLDLITSDMPTVTAAMGMLKSLHDMVLKLSTRTEPTAHLVLHYIDAIAEDATTLRESGDTVGARQFGRVLAEKWDARFGPEWRTVLVWRAARLLHPATVFQCKVPEMKEVAALLRDSTLVKDADKLLREAAVGANPFAAAAVEECAWDTQVKGYIAFLGAQNAATAPAMSLPSFWKAAAMTAPAVAALARSVLAIPASTIDVESLFSTAGNITSPHRSRLTPRLAERLILLNCWSRSDPSVRVAVPEAEDPTQDEEWVEGLVAEEADISDVVGEDEGVPAAGGAGAGGGE